MSDEQIGRYIRLLCFQHQNGHLSEATMKSLCKGTDEIVFSRLLKDDNEHYYNKEMELEVQSRTSISKTNSDNANTRWGKEESYSEKLE